jgi:hypothetical protein
LAKEGIYPKDYAHGVARHFCGWVKSKGWDKLPINVFCGQWAIRKYKEEIGNSDYLPATTSQEELAVLMYDELRVARYFISNRGMKTYGDVVEELKPVLSDAWLERYANDNLDSVRKDVLVVLRKDHRRIQAINYEDFFS